MLQFVVIALSALSLLQHFNHHQKYHILEKGKRRFTWCCCLLIYDLLKHNQLQFITIAGDGIMSGNIERYQPMKNRMVSDGMTFTCSLPYLLLIKTSQLATSESSGSA